MRNILAACFTAALALAASCLRAAAPPRPAHLVIVIEENHSFSRIIGSRDCPYLNRLAGQGALLTRSHAVTHPSEPNYLALFAGRAYGFRSDQCPPPGSPYADPNLGSLLLKAGDTFAGYAEGLPEKDPLACSDGAPSGYRRKHVPWVDFSNVPASANLPFSSFPRDFNRLPDVALVIPNLTHDMHDGTPAQGDRWLVENLKSYIDWCPRHDSMILITFDEDNGLEGNRIPTLWLGAHVVHARVGDRVNHYGLLKTICGLYGLRAPGHAARARSIARFLFR